MVKSTYPKYLKYNTLVNHFFVVIIIYQTKLVLKCGKNYNQLNGHNHSTIL